MSATPGHGSVRLAVVAAYPAVRAGLRALATGEEDIEIEVVTEAARLSDLGHDLAGGVDVVLIDLDATGALEAALDPAALTPDVGLVLLAPVETAPDDAPDGARLAKLMDGRAWAYLSRDADAAELTRAIAAVAQGLVVLQPALLQRLLAPPASAAVVDPAGIETLTAREHEVLQLVAEGLPNKAIALRLGISEHTVKFHITAILGKLGAGSRTEAVRLGARRGLIIL